MDFNRFKNLPPYPFARMRRLLADSVPEDTSAALNMSVGEPQHAVPAFVMDILSQTAASYNKYPPIQGTQAWQQAVRDWLTRRNTLPEGLVTAENLVPLSGSREGLYAIGQVVINRQKNGQIPLVLSPNPFYQPYAGAALSAGAEILYVNSQGGMPDYENLPEETLKRTALAFICNPSNPEGRLASPDYLARMIRLARTYDFTLVADECYSEIYDKAAPTGLLDVCHQIEERDKTDNIFRNILVFNSLSKRSSLAGLRSGFMAGDREIIAETLRLRSYGGAPLPLPTQEASAAAWNDEDHVAENRALYRQKFDLSETYLGGKFAFQRPAGGFCLWLDVGDGEAACKKLWRKAGIKSLPGAYLARPDEDGHNPGLPYIRLVLVHDERLLEPALEKIAKTL